MKTVFIAGASGLLGLHLAMKLRESTKVHASIHNRSLEGTGLIVHRIELADMRRLGELFMTIEPDLVINAAGFTSVEGCEADPDRAYQENVEIAASLARAAKEAAARFVHISTDHLFAGGSGLYSETDVVQPLNIYARTKAVAEERCLAINPETLILRTNFYGWGPSYRASFSDWILQRLIAKVELPLFKDSFYTPIHIDRLIDAAMGLLDRNECGLFNVTGSAHITKLEFGRALARVFELSDEVIRPSRLTHQADMVRRPLNMGLSNEKLLTTLGWEPVTLDSELALLQQIADTDRVKEIKAL